MHFQLLAFTGSHPVPHPNWGYGLAQMDLCKLQSLLKAILGLLERGLMGVEILQATESNHFIDEK
jgi:hypothetical protein